MTIGSDSITKSGIHKLTNLYFLCTGGIHSPCLSFAIHSLFLIAWLKITARDGANSVVYKNLVPVLRETWLSCLCEQRQDSHVSQRTGTSPLICWKNRSHHYIDVEVYVDVSF